MQLLDRWLHALTLTSSPRLHRASRLSEDDGSHYHELLTVHKNYKLKQDAVFKSALEILIRASWAEFHYLLGVLETNRNVPVVWTAHRRSGL